MCAMDNQSLSFLEGLKKYTFESKMLFAQVYSCRIMGVSGITPESCSKYTELIALDEIEKFTLYSILYDSSKATKVITDKEFCEFIKNIRNHWPSKLDSIPEDARRAESLFMLLALQQTPVQDSFLFKLFRYDYFYNFVNDNINMQEIFLDMFDVSYDEYESFAYVINVFLGLEMQNSLGRAFCAHATANALKNNVVLRNLSITKDKYREELSAFYKGKIEDYFYGIKIQYLYPLIECEDSYYIPQPYLIVNAVTESFLNRLTERNSKLRGLIGKEVIESYLYDQYRVLPSVSWISKEISYGKGQLSPDVIAVENGKCIFFDTKTKTPSLKLRQLNDSAIEKDITICAENIVQLYRRINDYLNGQYTLEGGDFSKDNIFAVSVILEDSYVSRAMIYRRVFKLLEDEGITLSEEEKEFIHGRIKIMPLKAIENLALRNRSILPVLQTQLLQRDKWDDYQFVGEFESDEFSPTFEAYHKRLMGYVNRIIHMKA